MAVIAQSSTPPAAATDSAAIGPSLGPLLLAMLLVVALIPVAIWMLKRLGPAQHAQVAGLKIVAQLPLGPRERVVVLEAGERWLLLGVTPTTITRIGTLPKGEQPPTPAAIASFASLLSAARGRSDAK
jgi:flagellar protein FliO/FliZ